MHGMLAGCGCFLRARTWQKRQVTYRVAQEDEFRADGQADSQAEATKFQGWQVPSVLSSGIIGLP